MNRIIIVLAFTIAGLSATAQTTMHSKPLKWLSLTFTNTGNNYEGKPQARASLLVTTAKGELPAQGWKIYFSFARLIVPASVTGGVSITHINGDYFCLSPKADFAGIKPNQQLNIGFTANEWMINITDAPSGFYLVYDSEPNKAYTIDQLWVTPAVLPQQYMRSPADKIQPTTPETIFAQNKSIRNIPKDSLVKVFPTPVSYHEETGSFVLDASVKVVSTEGFRSEEQYLKETLSGLLIAEATGRTPGKTIQLIQKPMPAEAYELTIRKDGVTISASTGAGIFYGIQSLKTMMAAKAWQKKQAVIIIKNATVKDEPRFGYRAVMLDVARNFQPKAEILKMLDVMSLYKLNILHFHLTDDEGWRLEIPELPELTEVGAKRGHLFSDADHLQPGLGSGPDADNVHGSGYYSKADFVEILRYATQRHIHIIPELESPGHARAAIKAMDIRYNRFVKLGQQPKAEDYLLHDLKDTSKYLSVQYYNDNVMDVSMSSVYRFVNILTASVVQLYKEAGAPLETIHFGGDEVPAGVWQSSPSFKKLMAADTSIKSTDNLWPYYYKKVDDILKAHSLYLTAWEEAGLVKTTVNNLKVNVLNKALLKRDTHLEVWNNVLGWGAEDLAYKQANAGYKVILSCVSNLYFDMATDKVFDEPGYYWGGYVDIDKLFKFIPYNYFKNTTEDKMGNPLNKTYLAGKEQLTDAGKANIVGLQGALWGETLKSPQRLEYMLLPKLLGLAERAWAADPAWANVTDTVKAAQAYNEAWSRFVNVLGKQELPRLDNYAGGFQYRIPQPGAVKQGDMILVNSIYPGLKVYYTLDGSIPATKSLLYTKPIPYNPNIKMAMFNTVYRSGRIVEVGK